MIEAYQEQLITLDELRERSPSLRKREATLQAELDALENELHDAETYLKLTETLDSFRARLGANAEQLTIEQRQQIVRLLVREVLVGKQQITIRHSIPTPNGDQPPGYSLRLAGQAPPRDHRRAIFTQDRLSLPRQQKPSKCNTFVETRWSRPNARANANSCSSVPSRTSRR